MSPNFASGIRRIELINFYSPWNRQKTVFWWFQVEQKKLIQSNSHNIRSKIEDDPLAVIFYNKRTTVQDNVYKIRLPEKLQGTN